MKLTSTKNRDTNLIRALVHGDSGIGKTTSLRTLPPDRTIIAAAERGLLPLRNMGYAVAVIESWDDVRELAKQMLDLTAFAKQIKEAGVLPEKFTEIRVLAIDSLSEISELCKRRIVTVDRRALVSDRTKGKRETPAGVYDDLMTMEDWNLYHTRMSSMLSAFCHLPVNIIFTCLSAWTEDKRTGTLYRSPNLSGKLAAEAPAFFDLVFHMDATEQAGEKGAENVRSWRTAHNGQVIAKDASGSLSEFVECDWGKVFTTILNGKVKK